MAATLKVLIQPKFAEIAETVQYPPTNCLTTIDKFTATNTSVDVATLTVHLVQSGGSASTVNAFSKTIPAGVTYTFPEIVGHVLGSSDFISTTASAPTLSIRASGRQFT